MGHFLQTEEEIEAWLKAHSVAGYTLVKNPNLSPEINTPWVVDVKTGREVDLSDMELTSIPVKFNQVASNFLCSVNRLTTLSFAPVEVGGYFTCSRNELTSLEFSPQTVGRSFLCYRNKIVSLKGAPKEVKGGFNCSLNCLTNLEYGPQIVLEEFICSYNQLNSLDFFPEIVGKQFVCTDNEGLGDFQKITNFQELLIQREAAMLQSKLAISQSHSENFKL